MDPVLCDAPTLEYLKRLFQGEKKLLPKSNWLRSVLRTKQLIRCRLRSVHQWYRPTDLAGPLDPDAPSESRDTDSDSDLSFNSDDSSIGEESDSGIDSQAPPDNESDAAPGPESFSPHRLPTIPEGDESCSEVSDFESSIGEDIVRPHTLSPISEESENDESESDASESAESEFDESESPERVGPADSTGEPVEPVPDSPRPSPHMEPAEPNLPNRERLFRAENYIVRTNRRE